MRGEALGPVKACCPSIGECHDRAAEVGGLVNRGRRDEIGVFGEFIYELEGCESLGSLD